MKKTLVGILQSNSLREKDNWFLPSFSSLYSVAGLHIAGSLSVSHLSVFLKFDYNAGNWIPFFFPSLLHPRRSTLRFVLRWMRFCTQIIDGKDDDMDEKKGVVFELVSLYTRILRERSHAHATGSWCGFVTSFFGDSKSNQHQPGSIELRVLA